METKYTCDIDRILLLIAYVINTQRYIYNLINCRNQSNKSFYDAIIVLSYDCIGHDNPLYYYSQGNAINMNY